jgi:hypothetical protein
VGKPYRGKLPPGFQLSEEDSDVELREDDRGRFFAVYQNALHPKAAASQVKNRVMTLRCTESEAALINMGWEVSRVKGSYGKKASKSDMLRFAAALVAQMAIEQDDLGVLPTNAVLARFKLEEQIEQDDWEKEALHVMEKSLNSAIASKNSTTWEMAINSARTIFRECTSIPTQDQMLRVIEYAESSWERR